MFKVKVKYSNRNNSAADCPISLKFRKAFDRDEAGLLHMFKVKDQRSRSRGQSSRSQRNVTCKQWKLRRQRICRASSNLTRTTKLKRIGTARRRAASSCNAFVIATFSSCIVLYCIVSAVLYCIVSMQKWVTQCCTVTLLIIVRIIYPPDNHRCSDSVITDAFVVRSNQHDSTKKTTETIYRKYKRSQYETREQFRWEIRYHWHYSRLYTNTSC